MKVRLLAFGHTERQTGFREKIADAEPDETSKQVWDRIAPALQKDGIRVAVDCEYVDWDEPIGYASEIALIPPVSGG